MQVWRSETLLMQGLVPGGMVPCCLSISLIQPLDFKTALVTLLEMKILKINSERKRRWLEPCLSCRRYPQVTSLRLEKLSPRVLTRQVLRLLERYGLDPGE